MPEQQETLAQNDCIFVAEQLDYNSGAIVTSVYEAFKATNLSDKKRLLEKAAWHLEREKHMIERDLSAFLTEQKELMDKQTAAERLNKLQVPGWQANDRCC